LSRWPWRRPLLVEQLQGEDVAERHAGTFGNAPDFVEQLRRQPPYRRGEMAARQEGVQVGARVG